MTADKSQTISKRRILISGGLAVGGPQTHVTILCRVLLDAGAEITIAAASTNWPAKAIAKLKASGVRVVVSPFGFGPMKTLGKIWALLTWPILLRRDYDVLYCVGEGKMHLWAARFLARNGWKIYHELVQCPERNSVGAQVAAQMNAVIANSRKVGDEMSQLLPEVPLRTIPFLTASAPIAPPPTCLTPRTLRIAFLGRLAPHKRPDQLIESWPEWVACAPIGPARLDLYGGDYDNEGDRLRTRIRELGLKDSVHLHGEYTTTDLPHIFNNTDIVVLPSRYEGLPLVLVEAMQRGIPVVATSAGGTAELGDDNPDVIITEGTEWDPFAAGLEAMAQRVRAGEINHERLHEWTESRYGFTRVSKAWRAALLHPERFFAEKPVEADLALL